MVDSISMIEVQNLTKFYGAHPAVSNLNFDARQGEILGFLGPNGAGKTTTMRILSGYMPPSSGTAKVAGFDVVDESLDARRHIGYLPETVPLYSDMSVRDYLTFMGSLRKVEDLDLRVDDVLEEIHLEEREDSLIGSLSKGMRQRVGLGQALVHQPDVLILDEPTIGLDPGQIIEVRKLIQQLGEERTVLLSTHILSEAQQVCDRVLIINNGMIVAEDSPGNLQAQMAGAEKLLVTTPAGLEELKPLLESMPGVTGVAAAAEDNRFEVTTSPGRDLRPDIARKIVEAGMDLFELGTAGVSLEEIFLQLTREQHTEDHQEQD
jgi:ABC-2 type transport system ATP-binding protein